MIVRVGKNINIYTICLVLLCIGNILELFVPRMDEGNYFVRLPIQLINGSLLFIMWGYLITKKIHWNSFTKSILLLVIFVILHIIIYYLGTSNFNLSSFSDYLKFLVWITAIIFFYQSMLKYGITMPLFQIYILTVITYIAKQILETSLFDSENLLGGDTASLPLLFIIPLVLFCFKGNSKIVLLSIVSLLILFSLRRTAILGLAICFPFLFSYIKNQLKTYHIVLFVIGISVVVVATWESIGEALIYRFEELFAGDGGGNKESFGSGRSVFYLTVWNNYWDGDVLSILFGNGLTTVRHMLMKKHNIGHAHNDFLEILYTFGLIGITLWLTFLYRLWKLKKLIKLYQNEILKPFYICFVSYFIIGLASGCVLRITTMPFAFSIAILLYDLHKGVNIKIAQQALSYTSSEEYQPVTALN